MESKREVFKYLVQPVLLERNGDGEVIGETALDVVAVYTREQLNELADRTEQSLSR